MNLVMTSFNGKHKLIVIIFFLLLGLAIEGCTSSPIQSWNQNVEDTLTLRNLTYKEFFFQVDNAIEDLREKYNDNSKLTIKENDVYGLSTEGGKVISFQTKNGDILRYDVILYAERGFVHYIYYYLPNNIVYIQVLRYHYLSNYFQSNQRFDFDQYQLEEYIAEGESLFQLSKQSQSLVKVSAQDVGVLKANDLSKLLLVDTNNK